MVVLKLRKMRLGRGIEVRKLNFQQALPVDRPGWNGRKKEQRSSHFKNPLITSLLDVELLSIFTSGIWQIGIDSYLKSILPGWEIRKLSYFRKVNYSTEFRDIQGGKVSPKTKFPRILVYLASLSCFPENEVTLRSC